MKKHLLVILALFIGLTTLNAQRQAETTQIEIRPINGTGFYGTLDFVYAFSDCFGDAQMLYTYKNVKTHQFHYNGKVYRPQDLDLTSFDKYILSPDITVNIMRPLEFFNDGRPRYGGADGGMQSSIKGNIKLTTVLDKQLAGCYGQTHKLGKTKSINPKYLYISYEHTAFLHYNSLLIDLIKCKENPENCNKKNDTKQTKSVKYYEINMWFISMKGEGGIQEKDKYGSNAYLGFIVNTYDIYLKTDCNPNQLDINAIKKYIFLNAKKLLDLNDEYGFSYYIFKDFPKNYETDPDFRYNNISETFNNIKITNLSEYEYSNILNRLNKNRDEDSDGIWYDYGSVIDFGFEPNCNNSNSSTEHNKK